MYDINAMNTNTANTSNDIHAPYNSFNVHLLYSNPEFVNVTSIRIVNTAIIDTCDIIYNAIPISPILCGFDVFSIQDIRLAMIVHTADAVYKILLMILIMTNCGFLVVELTMDRLNLMADVVNIKVIIKLKIPISDIESNDIKFTGVLTVVIALYDFLRVLG